MASSGAVIESPYRDPAVAEVYRRVAVPAQFVRPARDLASTLAIIDGAKVLDVGTGTGALASAAAGMAGPSGLVVGVDRASAMIRASDLPGKYRLVVGETPGLPFADATFDAVGASFVLPHCRDYSSAVADMVRVCRPGGRVATTAWGSLPNAPGRLWKEVVDTCVDPNEIEQAFRAAVPWEEWFSVANSLERALTRAGLTAVHTTTREYTVEIARDDYLVMRKAGIEGRLVRQLTDDAAWIDFTNRVSEQFRTQFPGVIAFVRDVHFGVGTKSIS